MRPSTFLALLVWLSACAPSGSPGVTPAGGAMELRLVDAPADDVTSIVLTALSLTAHTDSGRITLAQQPATVDLLKLQNGCSPRSAYWRCPQARLLRSDSSPTRTAPTSAFAWVAPSASASVAARSEGSTGAREPAPVRARVEPRSDHDELLQPARQLLFEHGVEVRGAGDHVVMVAGKEDLDERRGDRA
jgi:hypothetical protein